jgi:anti-sigma factor RsiW
MTRCADVERLVTAYVDGELDDQRSSAVRGHLRTCAACAERVEDEARVRELAADLESVEPPRDLWSAIDARLAEAEIGDSRRSSASLTVRRLVESTRRNLWPIGLGAAAVAVLLVFWLPGEREAPSPAASAPTGAARAAVARAGAPAAGCAAAGTHEEQVLCQMHESDGRYLTAIEDLGRVAAEERAAWTADEAARFDGALAGLDRAVEIERVRLAGSVGVGGPAARDPLHAIYRKKIDLLTSAVVSGDLALASTGGGAP